MFRLIYMMPFKLWYNVNLAGFTPQLVFLDSFVICSSASFAIMISSEAGLHVLTTSNNLLLVVPFDVLIGKGDHLVLVFPLNFNIMLQGDVCGPKIKSVLYSDLCTL